METLVLEVDNSVTSIVQGSLSKELYSELKRALGWRPENAEYMIRQYAEKVRAQCIQKGYDKEKTDWCVKRAAAWDGYFSNICYNSGSCHCFIKKRYTHFWTGLLHKALQFFKKWGVPYRCVDVRAPAPPRTVDFKASPALEMRDYQIDARDKACNIGRGIIKCATGGGKCLGKGTSVMMYDGTVKPVEDVRTGEMLMGPDSRPRKVLSICSGVEMLYRVTPTKGDSYVVNESHILSLKVYRRQRKAGKIHTTVETRNLTVLDYLAQNKTFKHGAKGYRVGLEFAKKEWTLNPYYLGLWLGDGTSRDTSITSADDCVRDFLRAYAEEMGVQYREETQKDNASVVCHLSTGRADNTPFRNPILNGLRKYNVLQNKHIPHDYKCNSREVRLEVLAGIMDSDGSSNKGAGYDFISKSETLANDVAYLARSLGLAAYVKPCQKTCTNNGVTGNYFRVSISGDCSVVPARLTRKVCHQRRQKKNVLVTGIKVESIGEGEYFGFEIDGDRLFLLGDFTVTHNTAIGASIIAQLGVTPYTFYVTSVDLLRQARDELQKFIWLNGSNIEVGAIGGGFKDIKDVNVMTVQTAIRSLDAKYEKFDEEDDGEDKTDISDIKKDIRELIQSSKGFTADEVQHWAAKTCQVIADASHSARYRFGLSATPWRDQGDDILIDACFGRPIVDISASFLIERGFLIQPEIYFLHVKNMKNCPYSTYQKIYQHALKGNKQRNDWIAKLALKFHEQARLPLVLCQHIDHGKLLQKMMPDSVFMNGTVQTKKRKAHLEALRSGSPDITIGTNIYDEGVDVKRWDTLLLAGGGKSATRAMQRIGRILRPYPDVENNTKQSVIAVDFWDHVPYLEEHAQSREKMYKAEPLFKIKHLDNL